MARSGPAMARADCWQRAALLSYFSALIMRSVNMAAPDATCYTALLTCGSARKHGKAVEILRANLGRPASAITAIGAGRPIATAALIRSSQTCRRIAQARLS